MKQPLPFLVGNECFTFRHPGRFMIETAEFSQHCQDSDELYEGRNPMRILLCSLCQLFEHPCDKRPDFPMTERNQVCHGWHVRRRLIVCADLLLFTAAIGIDGLAGWPKADSEVMNQYIQYMTQVTRFD